MELDYERTAGHILLRMKTDLPADERSYPVRMLLTGSVPSLLPCTLQHLDGGSVLTYDVSGRKPLSVYLERSVLDGRSLRRVLEALFAALEALSDYLLTPEQVLSDPRYLFYDWDTGSLRFLLDPSPGPAGGNFRVLSEALLSCADENDPAAVLLAFRFFRLAHGKADAASSLLTILGETPSSPLQDAPLPVPEDPPSLSVPVHAAPEGADRADPEDAARCPKKADPRPKGLRGLFAALRKKKEEMEADLLEEEAFLSEESPLFPPVSETPPASGAGRTCVPDPVSGFSSIPGTLSGRSPGTPPEDHTVLLCAGEGPAGALLIPSPEGALPRIELRQGTTRIGKLPSLCDAVIPQSSVSRLHARIEGDGGTFRIEDLSSKNGTTVNGTALLPGSRTELKNGDRVRIAAVEYEFRLLHRDP